MGRQLRLRPQCHWKTDTVLATVKLNLRRRNCEYLPTAIAGLTACGTLQTMVKTGAGDTKSLLFNQVWLKHSIITFDRWLFNTPFHTLELTTICQRDETVEKPNALLRLVMIGDNVGGVVLWFSPSTIYMSSSRQWIKDFLFAF